MLFVAVAVICYFFLLQMADTRVEARAELESANALQKDLQSQVDRLRADMHAILAISQRAH